MTMMRLRVGFCWTMAIMVSAVAAFQPVSNQQQQQLQRSSSTLLSMASSFPRRQPSNSFKPWEDESGDNTKTIIQQPVSPISAAQGIHDLQNAVAHSQFKPTPNRRSAAMTMPPEMMVRDKQPLPLVEHMMLAQQQQQQLEDAVASNTEEDAWWDDEDDDEGVDAGMGEITVGKMSYLDSLVPEEQQHLPTFIPSPLSKNTN